MASVKYLPVLPWVLPLALSFYGFQSLTYTIDIYRRDAKPAESYLAYLASASFFPTTVAGPITRISTLLPQWSKREMLTAQDGGKALFLIGLGLVKKLLIADFLAESLVNRVFDLPKLYSGAEVLAGVYGYALQLYYDFSGYTDIAIGSALLLGITLPRNFNRPYAAQNISDFWRRWHISFSNWLRDYLYFSLPGLRSRWKIFAYLNLVITMVIGGLWHGASWTFVVWGAWHGIGLAAHRGWQALHGNPKLTLTRGARFLCGLATFHFVLVGWIFFRASSLATARDILYQIIFRHHLLCERHSGVRAGGCHRRRRALYPEALVRWRSPTLLPIPLLRAGRGHRGARGCHSIRRRIGLGAVHLFPVLSMLPPMFPKKTSLAIATLGALLLLLESAKLARPFTLSEVFDFRPRDIPNVEPLPPMPEAQRRSVASKRPIIEPNLIDQHDTLRPFYLALWRTELGAPGAITRVLHYGDSPVTADSITADVRSLLQQHFGDAGHGFVLIAKPWAWYGHRGVEVQR